MTRIGLYSEGGLELFQTHEPLFSIFVFFHSQEKRAEFPPSPKIKRQQDFGDTMVTAHSNTTREGFVTTTLYISHKKVFKFIVFIVK